MIIQLTMFKDDGCEPISIRHSRMEAPRFLLYFNGLYTIKTIVVSVQHEGKAVHDVIKDPQENTIVDKIDNMLNGLIRELMQ